ncbi:molybdate ABC transporter ATP-binding protein ModF [Verrucomicrobiaceae bacterium R5-34]|uniref:Molybdate ABC transporter ATP-binding protein ModF n=1 Tax=Oceaniferula flava TaxID=2800421 RepID=A0AAE2VDP8_9BACT|nr:molybdate ABC transporter ATP-binding protein ModF [Oceaniferula flavus]MBK1830273.1 molybdate ABC transporter ATP-binding protein ModF [Verrucomicrobiaceae bacterium R5-34]MBK1854864.1 molybdate ABC transporter ATP-binding protein ModF [Oceaniferula flavus]MBM1136170.1 molybdate ABC transporter ATP-binding protein ModF [Oceaniferula flavus]
MIKLSGVGNGSSRRVAVPHFEIEAGEHWAVIGGNGSGKSTFAAMLAGAVNLSETQRVTGFEKVLLVSFEDEQRLLEREIYEDDSESMDRIDYGRTTHELITELAVPDADIEGIIETMQLQAFLHTGFRILSTGERRRMMIARALSQAPDMLVLDEPYDGLDHAFVSHLKEVIAQLSLEIPVVLIVNRLSHLGDHITHLACLHQMQLVLSGERKEVEQSALWQQLQSMGAADRPLPSALEDAVPYQPLSGQPIIDMRSVDVGYHNKEIIRGLDWQIMPGEHWKISGPNGSGKSTLVNLVSGDHPQCYSNEIYLFGQRRGQGESIWDIKRHMGLMSTALHQQYRVRVPAETVLVSGFFDSIGIYQPVSREHKRIGAEWLEFLQLDKHAKTNFQNLSFGQQRMLLIARALIKRPHLLILDEPCQGLDPINRALVIQLIDEIARRKIAQVLYISHDAEDHLDCLTHELRFEKIQPCPESGPAYAIAKGEI